MTSLFSEIEFNFIDPREKEPEDCQRCLFILTANHYLDAPEVLAGTYYRNRFKNSNYLGRFVLGYNNNNLGFNVEKDGKFQVIAWCKMPTIPEQYISEPPKRKQK